MITPAEFFAAAARDTITIELSFGALVATAFVLAGFACVLFFTSRFYWWLRKPKFRVRCPQCLGTGVCHNADGTVNQDAEHPMHSCCGDCGREIVPTSYVPDLRGFNHGDGRIMLGKGWIPGTLWQRLRAGGPNKKLGVR